MSFVSKVKQAQSPPYAALYSIGKFIRTFRIPQPIKPMLRGLYRLHLDTSFVLRWLFAALYIRPLFESRCESVGTNLVVWKLPRVQGSPRIFIGSNVTISGHVNIWSSASAGRPTLIIKDRVFIGPIVRFALSGEIVIEDDVLIANDCSIADSDGHPRDARMRAAGMPQPQQEVKAVRICRRAWIGQGSMIRKGVIIGEGAIVGAGSVVINDVPPYCIVLGNPARIVGFSPGAEEQDNPQ